MTRIMLTTAALASLAIATPELATAKGCVRGAVAGAVVGHYVGKGHALAGAAAGCMIARRHYAKQAEARRAAARH
jgi:uncharacterized protein YcfJ